MPSVAVRNFGCRANQAEAFAWADALSGRGLTVEADGGRSDVVLVHSCTLTGRADRDVRKLIRRIGRQSPGTRIVVTGCYAERAPDELLGLPNVAAVLPRSAGGQVAETVAGFAAERAAGRGRIAPEAARTVPANEGALSEGSYRARAYLKVQDGCDNRCAFCVIPSLRGRSASVPPAEAAASARNLANRGFREIVLAGIHLASYGRDLEPRRPLVELLREVGEAAAPARLRLSSLDPNLVDDGLAARLAGDGRICPHFHLSLQHASERVLRSMGRAGGPRSYERILGGLRRLAPDAALGADIIVGFPGETEADFEELRAFVEASALTYVHVFPFSPRPGTPAWGRTRIADDIVTYRVKTMRALSAAKDLRFRGRFAGRTLEAVVIGKTGRGAEVMTANGIKVDVAGPAAPRRELVRVKIGRVVPQRTEGEVLA
jgi:threonylcarbamoyladenosine tRNA methylthiotransferase MtaB